MSAANLPMVRPQRPGWNKGRMVGQKRPLQPMHVSALRERLELADRVRDLAMFNMAVNSTLRGCDLVKLKEWVASIGLVPSAYETHSMRRTKAAQIYKKTGNLCAIQLLLGYTKMESTLRCRDIELEEAPTISARIEI